MTLYRLAVLATLARVILVEAGRLAALQRRLRPAAGALDAMVCQIAERHFPLGRLVVVAEQSEYEDDTAWCLLRAQRWAVLSLGPATHRSRRRPGWLIRQQAASVLIAGDYPHLQQTFTALRRDFNPYWNNTAAFLVVLQQDFDQDEVCRWLMAMWVTNVVFVQDLPEDSDILLFSALPPRRAVCQRALGRLTLVDQWLPGNMSFARDQRDLYLPRAPEDCGRCPVYATRSTFPDNLYQAEDDMVNDTFNSVMRAMGCSVVITEYSDGDYAGHQGDDEQRVIEGEADVVLRYLWITLNRTKTLSATSVLHMERIDVFLRSPGPRIGTPLCLELAVMATIFVGVLANRCLGGRHSHGPVTPRSLLECRPYLGLHRPQGTRCWSPALSRQGRWDHRRRGCDWARLVVSMWALYSDQPTPFRLLQGWNRVLWTVLALSAITLTAARKSTYASNSLRPQLQRIRTVDELTDHEVTLGINDPIMFALLNERAPATTTPFADGSDGYVSVPDKVSRMGTKVK